VGAMRVITYLIHKHETEERKENIGVSKPQTKKRYLKGNLGSAASRTGEGRHRERMGSNRKRGEVSSKISWHTTRS